ncbi:hypothetical protein P3W45_000604 [Vairimorpha bombi]
MNNEGKMLNQWDGCTCTDNKQQEEVNLETGNVYDFKEHTYQAMTSSEMRILLFRDDLLRDSTSSRKTKNEIICSASLFLDDSERLQLPSDKNLKWTIRNIQDEAHNFSFIKNYDIPSELMLSRSGFPFVQYDNYFDGKERLIDLWCQKNVAYEKMFDFVVLKNVGIKNISNIIVDFEAAIENGLMNKFANVGITSEMMIFIYTRIVLDILLTNNGAEGHNLSLKNEIIKAHPSLVELLICLRNRDYLFELDGLRTEVMKQSKLNYIENNKKILLKLRDFSNGNYIDILKQICALYNFKDDILN